jgi:diaminobutyrate-2-oxoglutarate transaminase
MDLDVFDTHESNVRGYVRSFPTVFDRAEGPIIYDQKGSPYIDFFSGAGGLNYGHNNPVLTAGLVEYLQSGGIIHGLDMATAAKKRFIEAFQSYILKPRKLSYKMQFTGPTGTNAVEAALKLARLNTGRTGIIAFTHGFHGVSLGSLATTANSWYRDAAGIDLQGTTFIPYDGYVKGLDSIAYFEQLLTDPGSGMSLPAAVIVECIQGEGGVNVASDKWLHQLRALTKKHDILMIVDEIQVGCGRTGEFFSFEQSGIVPDMITLSKSISASGLPMALLLIAPVLDIWKPGQHNGTFRGNNLAFVSAAIAIETFWKDDTLQKDVHRKAKIVHDALSAIASSYPALKLQVVGRGLIQGIKSDVDHDFAKRVSKEAFAHGLIIETAGSNDEVLKFLPALTIDDAILQKGLDIVTAAAKQTA